MTSLKDITSQTQYVNACLDFTWTQLANAKKYVEMADYFMGSATMETRLTVMVVPQLVKSSLITSVSTAHKHINQIVFTMVVISVSL